MTFKGWWDSRSWALLPKIRQSHRMWCELSWNTAIAAERERCVKIVRDSEGKFVSLSSCEALVDEIRRTP